jgi:hypothetical protein
MGFMIFLRKRFNVNKFRDIMLSSIATGHGNQVLLCSGFFQENFKTSSYQVSQESSFDQVLLKHSIELTTVGIHNNSWLQSYKNFRDNLNASGVNIIAKYATKFHWHAKIYILKLDGRPIFGILGSSNMTRNAFSTTNPFNFESDVIMWLDEFEKFNDIYKQVSTELSEFSEEIINVDYDPNKNFGLTIEDRLKQIVNDVESIGLKDLS